MFKVNNKKAVNTLAIKSFKASKSRNIIAIVAIMLTTVLFTTLFTVGIGITESIERETFRQAGSDAHGSFKHLTDEEYAKLKTHPSVVAMAKNILCAEEVTNKAFLKRRVELWYSDQLGLEWSLAELSKGALPKDSDQIMMDEKSLKLLGVPAEIGQKITLQLKIKPGKAPVTRDFALSGVLKSDEAVNVGFAMVSESYLSRYAEELAFSGLENGSNVGSIRADVKFASAGDIQSKLDKVVLESGYSVLENHNKYIETGVNWAYLNSNGVEPSAVASFAAGLLMVAFAGYLIIYNIFQISVHKDIRFYGLLKTIGTTSRQIKGIVVIQALMLSGVGIPLGLVTGFAVGKILMPVIMAQSTLTSKSIEVSANPQIFGGSALFALVTVLMSTWKPGKTAGNTAAVEAVRFSGNDSARYKQKKSTDGGKLYKMALANLGRNKKRTVITVLSLSLSLVLFNTVFSLSKSFDMDKYVENYVATDFLVAHADYMTYKFDGIDNCLSDTLIQAVTERDGFIEGGRLYGNLTRFKVDDPNNLAGFNKDESGKFYAVVYGLEDFPISLLKVAAGALDVEKFKTGDYIVERVSLDEDGKPNFETAHFKPGQQVVLSHLDAQTGEQTSKTYSVMALVSANTTALTARTYVGYDLYLPASAFKAMEKNSGAMSYIFNVKEEAIPRVEAFLKKYTQTDEIMMNYESKQTYVNAFMSMQNMVITVGGTLSGILGLIGVLNFINATLTGILTRKTEFATMESIGMTRGQLSQMLICEGVYYVAFTMGVSLLLAVGASVVVVKGLTNELWFMTWNFTIEPLLMAYPIVLIVGITVPMLLYHSASKQSIVEVLREVG